MKITILSLILLTTLLCRPAFCGENQVEVRTNAATSDQNKSPTEETQNADMLSLPEIQSAIIGCWDRLENGSQLSLDGQGHISLRTDIFPSGRYLFSLATDGQMFYRIDKDKRLGKWVLYVKEPMADGSQHEEALFIIDAIGKKLFEARYINNDSPVDWTAKWKHFSIKPWPINKQQKPDTIPKIQKVDTNTQNHSNETLANAKLISDMLDATKSGDLDKVKALLKANPGLVSDRDDKYGATPLHLAAGYGHKDVAELLLANKAEVNAKDNIGWTPLLVAAGCGQIDVVTLLLSNKADPNVSATDGQTPLHLAASRGDKGIIELLMANHADVNTASIDGRTPLFMAWGNGHNDIVELLRQHGGHE